MPGTAFINAPEKNADKVNALPESPVHRNIISPHITLPVSIEMSNEM